MLIAFTTRNLVPVTALSLAVWIVSVAPASAQDAAQIKRGQEVYAAQKCQVCHSIAGVGNKTNPLEGVGLKPAAEIRAWIVTPIEMAKKTASTRKPPMQNRYASLPAADIDALVAYMQSLNKKL